MRNTVGSEILFICFENNKLKYPGLTLEIKFKNLKKLYFERNFGLLSLYPFRELLLNKE